MNHTKATSTPSRCVGRASCGAGKWGGTLDQAPLEQKQGLLYCFGTGLASAFLRCFSFAMAAVGAPPAPIPVQSPVVPRTAATPVFLPAGDALVTATSFLPWEAAPPLVAGGAPRVSMPTHKMVKAWLTRCRVSRTPADQLAANQAHLLNVGFTAAFWSRILTLLRDAGVNGSADLHSPRELRSFIKGLAINPVTPLEVVAADWALGPAFVLPAGAGAAAQLRASLTPVRFISLATIPRLEAADDPAEPWTIICELAGAFGAVLTQAARADEVGQLQIAVASIRAYQSRVTLDGPLALGLKTFMQSNRLPVQLRSDSVEAEVLSDDLLDGLRYRTDKAAVEEKRIHLVAPRCVTGSASSSSAPASLDVRS